MFLLTPLPSTSTGRTCIAAVLGLAVASAGLDAAGAPASWHPDLAAARLASSVSRRPVLAVFTATWSPESEQVAASMLSDPEVAALVAACFEPIRVDVDADPRLTQAARIARVPTACVLGPDDRVLATFECPGEPAAFIGAAGRALQEAGSALAAGAPAAREGESAPTMSASSGGGLTAGAALGGLTPEHGDPAAAEIVAAKVRRLSSFADTAAAQPATASAPDLPAAPPAWPAEPSRTTLALGGEQPASPVAATPPAQPWLASPAAATPARPPIEPEASATASDLAEPAQKKSAMTTFLEAFQKPFSVFSRPQPASTATVAPPPTLPPAHPTSPLATTATAGADPYGSMPLGLEGYCPVTLAERGVWVEGRAQWGARHRGRTYLFAGAEQQQAFLANPDRFAPALSGDDPVLALDSGKATPGRRCYGVTYQSRMYLFATPESRSTFAANPDRYTTRILVAERTPSGDDATRRY